MSISGLMIAVAVVALLLFFEAYLGDRLFFGLLPVLAAIIGIGYRRLKPPDHRVTPSERIMVGLAALAILSPSVALRLAWMRGPSVGLSDRFMAFFIVLAAGVAPLSIFLLSAWLLRGSPGGRCIARGAGRSPRAVDRKNGPDPRDALKSDAPCVDNIEG
jgi:hypothetical protein